VPGTTKAAACFSVLSLLSEGDGRVQLSSSHVLSP